MTILRRLRGPFVLAASLPLLGGAGTCGILFDLWSWDEITDHAERVVVDVDRGALEITAYDRGNIWLQRHVYSFEKRIAKALYGVEDGEFELTFHCGGRGDAVCFADHWLEIPTAMPVEVTLDEGHIALIGLAGDFTADVGDVPLDGADLGSPYFEVRGDAMHEIDLTWTARPQSVTIDVDRADVVVALPAGSYVCDLDVEDDPQIDPTIVCDDAADASLSLVVRSGSLQLDATP
ncbi:MAG: hypothetical protein K1X88_29100 [Nannocystaceae bacterium]|nr:hypothetical protein [Nannocystaceae bacterium]